MPSPSSLFVDPSLSAVSAARGMNDYVASRIFPGLIVEKQQGVYFNSDPDRKKLRELDLVRAPGGMPVTIDNANPTTTAYSSIDHSARGFATDEESGNADEAARAEITAVEDLTDAIMLKKEIEIVTLIATISQTGAPSTKWDVLATGDMIADVKAQKETIALATGKQPNVFVTTQSVLDEASETDRFRDRAKYTMGPDALQRFGTKELVAAMLDVDEVLTGESWKNTAVEGQTAVVARVWGETALLFYREPPRQRSSGFGLHLNWTGGMPELDGFMVERARDADRKAEKFVVHHYYDQVLLNATAGFYFTAVLT